MSLNPIYNNGIPELTVENTKNNLNAVRLIDVRQPQEFNGELGHIAGAELVTLGPDLMEFLNKNNKDETLVFVCRSGGRSGQATQVSQQMGFQKTFNMIGGMIAWNEAGYSVVKD